MSEEKINYEEFLKDEFWPLDVAISLKNGEKPNTEVVKIYNNTTLPKVGIILQNEGNRSHVLACEAIESKKLTSIKREDLNLHLGDKYFGYSRDMFFVKPRDFINWCNDKQIHVASELIRYFDYQYWLSQDYWSFNEAALLFLKDSPPFPHEIRNVFEIDEKHNEFARNLAQKLLDTKTRGIEGEWLYWLMKSQPNNTKTLERFCPTATNDFVNQNTYLSKTVLLKIVSKHMNDLLDVSNFLKDKVKKLIEQGNIEEIHGSHIKNYLIKTVVNDDGFQNDINNVCTAELFLIALARLPELESSREILEQIASIQFCSEKNSPKTEEEIYARKIKLRLGNLEEYKLLFKRDNQSQILYFLLQDSDKEILQLQGRIVDFVNWAKGHNIPIPPELEKNKAKTLKNSNEMVVGGQLVTEEKKIENGADIQQIPVGTNLNLIILETFKLLTASGKEPKTIDVFNEIKRNQNNHSSVIEGIKDMEIEWKVSGTAEIKTMTYKTFQNLISSFKTASKK